MNRKRALAIGFLFMLLGGIIGYYSAISSRTIIREIEVVSLEARLEWSAEILASYYGIETEKRFMPNVGTTNIKIEILDFQTFVNWLDTNGFNKCYYEYSNPLLSKEQAFFWVWHENTYYYWEL